MCLRNRDRRLIELVEHPLIDRVQRDTRRQGMTTIAFAIGHGAADGPQGQ